MVLSDEAPFLLGRPGRGGGRDLRLSAPRSGELMAEERETPLLTQP